MKYLALDPFKKHLEASFPSNLSLFYLVVALDDFERTKIIDNIACYLPRSILSMSKMSSSSSMKEITESLCSPSLFGGQNVVIIDELENFKNQDIQLITSHVKQNKILGFVIFAARNKKSFLTLFNEIDKRGVVLDLSQEKTWDKEKRLSNFIVEKCARAKKSITPEAIAVVFSQIGTDMSAIENEIDKVSAYVGEKYLIEKKDILEICSLSNTSTIWQIAEEMVWDDPFASISENYIVDSVFFHSLVIALRYHLQEGYKMAEAIEKKLVLADIFPALRPKALQKRKEKALACGSGYFKEALKSLFEIDLQSKSGSPSFTILLDIFRAKL